MRGWPDQPHPSASVPIEFHFTEPPKIVFSASTGPLRVALTRKFASWMRAGSGPIMRVVTSNTAGRAHPTDGFGSYASSLESTHCEALLRLN